MLRRTAEIAPDSKLLLVIRNQVDMIISTYSQYVLAGGTKGINEFANDLLKCSSDGRNYFCTYFDEIIGEAEKYFGDRLYVMLLEDMLNDQSEQLVKLFDFIGLPPQRFKDSF